MNEEPGLSLRDLVLEIRADVRALDVKVDRLEREGTLFTALQDHETRMRSLERWRYGIPVSILIAVITAVAIVLRALEA